MAAPGTSAVLTYVRQHPDTALHRGLLAGRQPVAVVNPEHALQQLHKDRLASLKERRPGRRREGLKAYLSCGGPSWLRPVPWVHPPTCEGRKGDSSGLEPRELEPQVSEGDVHTQHPRTRRSGGIKDGNGCSRRVTDRL